MLPTGASLPAFATSYFDVSPPAGLNCYILVVLAGSGNGISDGLCFITGLASPVGSPQNFAIQINQSSATLSWTGPLGGGQDGYVLAQLGGSTINLGGNETSRTGPISGPTCFVLFAVARGLPLGNTGAVCGIPGLATLPQPSSPTSTPSRTGTPTPLVPPVSATSTANAPVTATRAGTPTFTATRTPIPGASVSFSFGQEVSPSDRQFVSNLVSMTQQYWGDAAVSMRVYAFSDMETLIAAYLRDCGCSEPGNFRQALQDENIATASGALLIQTSPTGWWGRESQQNRAVGVTHSHFHAMQASYLFALQPFRSGFRVEPVWLTEGGAEYARSRVMGANGLLDFNAERNYFVQESRSMCRQLGSLEEYGPPLGIGSIRPGEAYEAYVLGFFASELLASSYGERSLLAYYRAYGDALTANGYWQATSGHDDIARVSRQQAFRSTFGLPLAEFGAQFDTYRTANLPVPAC